MKKIDHALVAMVKGVIGQPDYAITLTMRPVRGPRLQSTKRIDAERAFAWFLHFLNTRCFGHGHQRKGIELGVFAALEGLGHNEQPHWHCAFRIPSFLKHERFLNAFETARKRTRRFGYEFDIQPFYEGEWIEYSLKTGSESFCPLFLRAGTP
jgi:hypothetical protein